jgi:hypothetical protein
MDKVSFFFRQSEVYEMSLKALQRRHFEILEADERNGVIKASTKRGFLKPGVKLELKIAEVDKLQTSVNIESVMKKSWFAPADYNKTVQTKFIRTLYNCFDMI